MAVQVLAGHWDFNVETRELLLCPRSRRMFGIEGSSPKTLGRYDWEPRVHPDDLPVIANELEIAGRRNAVYSARFRTLLPDGSRREILGIGQAVAGDPKRFIGLNFDLIATAASAAETQLGGRAIASPATCLEGSPKPANENELPAWRLRSSIRAADSMTPRGTVNNLKREFLLRMAQATMRLRELRQRFLNPAMFGEPAFDLLLALYVTGASRTPLSVRALSPMIGFPESTIARWLRFLVDDGLALSAEVESGDPGGIAAAITEEGRAALDDYFGLFDVVQ